MSKEKPSPCHVATNSGTLHSEHDNIDQATAAAEKATKAAAALGSKVTFVASDNPYPFK
jgi:hypothetical protein